MALVSPTRTTNAPDREPLLSYDLTTDPDPLKASEKNPSTPEERGELIIVGSRRHRDPADVERIKVKVPQCPSLTLRRPSSPRASTSTRSLPN